MAGNTGRIRECRKRLVALGLSLLGLTALGGQEAGISIEPRRIVRGDMANIRIRTSIPWGQEVEIRRPELDESLVWIAYPSVRSWTPEGEPEVRLVEALAKIQLTRSGIFSLGSFRILSNGWEAVTSATELIGLERDEANLPYPVFVEWRTLPKMFWQSQAVPIVLEARNLTSLILADATLLREAPVGLLEDVRNLETVQTRQFGGDVLYDVPMASWIWTVNEQGRFEFPAVRISVGGLSRWVEARAVDVLPLPEEAQESSAVGRFKLDVSWDEGPYSVGDIVSVRVRVSGTGNLNVLKLPAPELKSAVLVGKGSSSSYVPTLMGYEGWREEKFDFQLDEIGNLSLLVPEWVWFDPEDGLREWTGFRTSLFASDTEAHGSNADLLLGPHLFRYRKSVFHWRNGYWAFLYLPGFLVLMILFLLGRMGKLDKELRIFDMNSTALSLAPLLLAALLLPVSAQNPVSKSELASRAVESARRGDWKTAAELYAEFEEGWEHPGFLHDFSIVHMELGKPDVAMASIRRALFLRPGVRRFKKTLGVLEEGLGFSNQVPLTLAFPPALVFIPLLLGVNGFFFSLVFLMFRRGVREFNFLVLCTFFLLSSIAAVGVCDYLWNRHTAAVREDSEPLRKIPSPLATDWVQLPAGELLSIVAFKNDDCLVRTGYGLEGWLPHSSLIIITGRYENGFQYNTR